MSILLLGATSDIGVELTRLIAEGEDVVLAARSPERAPSFPQARSVHHLQFEATNVDAHEELIHEAESLAGPISTAIVAFGILGEQGRAERDSAHAVDIAMVDYVAQISMITALSNHMRTGRIIAFSSVAGTRARRANYVYGSTKAGLDAFCEGLIDRLHNSELEIYLARPGFVIGSMTEGMKPAPMSVRPHDVAQAVVKRFGRPGAFWIPRRLGVLALAMRLTPRPVWRKMPR